MVKIKTINIQKLGYTKKKITPYDSAESKTELSFSCILEIRPEQRSCEQTLDDSPEWSDFYDNEFAKKPVIDVETIDAIDFNESRTKLRPSIVGIFYKDEVKQIVLENIKNINKFKSIIIKELDELPQPFLAFNKDFDKEIIFGFTGRSYLFKEIQEFKYQKKHDAKLQYGLDVYDPFHGDGLQAVNFYQKYLKTNDKKLLNFVIQHNRACLVTEHLIYRLRNRADKIKKPIEKIINKAFDERLRVRIVYPSSDLRWRKVEIYEMENGFINAFCHLRNEMRNFRISEIQDVQLTEESYEISKDFPKMRFY